MRREPKETASPCWPQGGNRDPFRFFTVLGSSAVFFFRLIAQGVFFGVFYVSFPVVWFFGCSVPFLFCKGLQKKEVASPFLGL